MKSIKDVYGRVLYEYPESMELKRAIEKAVREGVSLSGAKLRHADLSGANLSGGDLSWASLDEVNMSKANLSGANFDDSHAHLSIFEDADMGGASLVGANLLGSRLEGANLYMADLSLANLAFSTFKHAELSLANMERANLSFANLQYASMHNTKIVRADISDIYTRNTNFSTAHVKDAVVWCGDSTDQKYIQGLLKDTKSHSYVVGNNWSVELRGPGKSSIWGCEWKRLIVVTGRATQNTMSQEAE